MPAGRDIITARLAGTDTAVTVALTEHAVERYIERVRPTAERDTAAAQIARLFGMGTIGPRPAAWDSTLRPAPLYLNVGDVSFALDADSSARERLVVRTCLARGMCWPPRRDRHRARPAPSTRATPYHRPGPGPGRLALDLQRDSRHA